MKQKSINFVKYAATGNDFIAIDNRETNFSSKFLCELAKRMCKRKFSVGADGMLILEDNFETDIKMRIINPDGSEVEMCGNGLRCIALFAKDSGLDKDNMSIQTLAGIIKISINNSKVKVFLKSPRNIEMNFDLNLPGTKIVNCNFINIGVPHVVTFLNDINNIDVVDLGRAIRYHDKFKPLGTNANFVKVVDNNTIKIRTYERGVEDETLACGTGAVASAVVSSLLNLVDPPIKVRTKSHEDLDVSFKKNKSINDLCLEGEVNLIYRGAIEVGI